MKYQKPTIDKIEVVIEDIVASSLFGSEPGDNPLNVSIKPATDLGN